MNFYTYIYHKFKGLNNSSFNSFFKYKSGIIGTKGYSKTLIYLSFKKKKNRKYKEIDFYLIPDNESINDFYIVIIKYIF